MKRKFWNWVRNEAEEERTLVLNGQISDETWFGDEVTPKLFQKELDAGTGNITVWINSPGGDVFAAAQIYNMLMEYKGDVTVKVDALAAGFGGIGHCHGRDHGADEPGCYDDDLQSHDHCNWGFQGNAEGRGNAG